MPRLPQLTKVVAAAAVTAALVGGGYVVSQQGQVQVAGAADVTRATVQDARASRADARVEASPAAASLAEDAQAPRAAAGAKSLQRLQAKADKRARLLARLVERKVELPVSFGLATFNILGAMHTCPGCDADHFPHWRMRAEWTGQYIQSKGLDIVGLQEVEPAQYDGLMAATGGAFDGWPAKYARGVHNRAIMTTLIWRTSEWTAVEKTWITIPFMKWQQESPVVKLRHNSTGREIWVINTHNAPRSLQGQRNKATDIEVAKINELTATGLPVFFVGDMNERNPIFSRIVNETPLNTPDRRQTGRIDYVFGPETGVSYSAYAVERPALITQITDHNVVRVDVKLAGS